MGGFLGIGTPKRVKESEGNLSNVFNYGMKFSDQHIPQGDVWANRGQDTLGETKAAANQNFNSARDITNSPLSMWQKLMSGNRTAVQQAVAPETNTALSMADATKRQTAQLGTARGGGNASTNTSIDQDAMAKIDNLLFGVRPTAAQAVQSIGAQDAGITSAQGGLGSEIGGKQAQIGQNEIQQALQALGLSTTAAGKEGDIALEQEKLNANGFFQKMLGDVASFGMDKFLKFASGGQKQA